MQKILTSVFKHTAQFGSQAKLVEGEKITLYKPADRGLILNGIYSFKTIATAFVSMDGNFSIVLVDIVRPLVPVGTVLTATFRKDADGYVGSATHNGQLVRVYPTNPLALRMGMQSYTVRVGCISAADNLVVYGEIKEGLTTRRGKIVEQVPVLAL